MTVTVSDVYPILKILQVQMGTDAPISITLTGDVTGTGVGTIGTTLTNGVVTLAKHAPLAATSLIANATAGSATPTAVPFSSFLQSANNLSDLTDLSVARDNLFPVVQIAANAPLLMNRRYHIDSSSGQIIGTLPLTWSVGDQIEIVGIGSVITGGGWAIVCNVGQTITGGGASTSSGGALVTDYPRDCVTLEAISATVLKVISVQGKGVRTDGGVDINMLNFSAPIAVADGGTGLDTVAVDKVLVGDGTLPLVPKGIVAGAGVVVTQDASNITISSNPGSVANWVVVTGTSQTIVPGTGYIANSGSLVTFTLPAVCPAGEAFAIYGFGAGGWKIAQGAGQRQYVGQLASTVGAGGFTQSTLASDKVLHAVCVTANTDFILATSGDVDAQ